MIGDLVADRVTGHGSGAFSLQDWVRPKLVAITVSGRHLILVICGAARAGAPRPGPDGARRGLSLRSRRVGLRIRLHRQPSLPAAGGAAATAGRRGRLLAGPHRGPLVLKAGVCAYPAAVHPALSAAVAHCAAATAGRHPGATRSPNPQGSARTPPTHLAMFTLRVGLGVLLARSASWLSSALIWLRRLVSRARRSGMRVRSSSMVISSSPCLGTRNPCRRQRRQPHRC